MDSWDYKSEIMTFHACPNMGIFCLVLSDIHSKEAKFCLALPKLNTPIKGSHDHLPIEEFRLFFLDLGVHLYQ